VIGLQARRPRKSIAMLAVIHAFFGMEKNIAVKAFAAFCTRQQSAMPVQKKHSIGNGTTTANP
jgi:hypothetical protein